MIRHFVAFVFLCLSTQGARAQAFLPFEGPRPIAVMIETNPWLMVMGSDTPSFALYEDGQVIYKNRSPKAEPIYLWKLLSTDELLGLKVRLASFGPFRQGNHHIELTEATDQSETKLFLDFKGAELLMSIYGIKFANMSQQNGRNRTPFPVELRQLHTFLSTLEFSGATEWTPKYIEAMAWNYDYAPSASVSWPKHWPGLESPTTIARKNMYSIFVPGNEMKDLVAFLGTRKDRGAIEIDGKKFAVSVRPVFPSEPVWRKALLDE